MSPVRHTYTQCSPSYSEHCQVLFQVKNEHRKTPTYMASTSHCRLSSFSLKRMDKLPVATAMAVCWPTMKGERQMVLLSCQLCHYFKTHAKLAFCMYTIHWKSNFPSKHSKSAEKNALATLIASPVLSPVNWAHCTTLRAEKVCECVVLSSYWYLVTCLHIAK